MTSGGMTRCRKAGSSETRNPFFGSEAVELRGGPVAQFAIERDQWNTMLRRQRRILRIRPSQAESHTLASNGFHDRPPRLPPVN